MQSEGSYLIAAAALALIVAALWLGYLMQSAYAPTKPVKMITSCRVELSPLAIKWCW